MILKQTLGGLRALALLCAIEACGGAATGDVLFNNFGPGNTYDVDNAWGTPSTPNQFERAMAFTVSDDYFLTMGEFGVAMSGGNPFLPNIVHIGVLADNAGVPGEMLEQVTLLNQMGIFGLFNPPLVANFSGSVLLSEGERYWMSVHTDAPTSVSWNLNSIGDQGLTALRIDGNPWTAAIGVRGVFRVHGTPVPAPGAIALLGLFACASRRRRRIVASA